MEKPSSEPVYCGWCHQGFYEPSEEALVFHHEPLLDHAGVKISQCEANRISADGP